MREQCAKLSRGHDLAKAMNYMFKRWGSFTRFLDVEEACEGAPALEHVVHGLGQIVTAGELGALLAHIDLQSGDQRRALRLANSPTTVGALAIARSIDRYHAVAA